MKFRHACLTALFALSSSAFAATPQYLVLDQSTPNLIDKASAAATLKEVTTPQMLKLYSPKKWGFATEVEGGFTASKTCVVTARVMMLPVGVSGKTLVFKAEKKVTTFDALPGATQEQCKELANAKLKEAVQAMVFSLIKS
ncbi:MAG: hypothetical protein IV097_14675 [Burkholderiaceae bacterium]|nr:hypothetical protein [Burkholderiaceae bacterium]